MSTNANPYLALGVRPFINCCSVRTMHGGSLMLPQVRDAVAEAARWFVNLDELMEAAGRRIAELTGAELPFGDIDISFYRDDVGAKGPATQPVVHASHIDFDLSERTVVLVDDVLFTGRTVRAAIDALFDYGRPRRVQLAVLCDRGHRELPIRPDYVGKNLPTGTREQIQVRLQETDNEADAVWLERES